MRYRHFKGGIYETLCMARLESDPNVNMVVYRAPDNSLWVRTERNFFETVRHEGADVPRFAALDTPPDPDVA